MRYLIRTECEEGGVMAVRLNLYPSKLNWFVNVDTTLCNFKKLYTLFSFLKQKKKKVFWWWDKYLKAISILWQTKDMFLVLEISLLLNISLLLQTPRSVRGGKNCFPRTCSGLTDSETSSSWNEPGSDRLMRRRQRRLSPWDWRWDPSPPNTMGLFSFCYPVSPRQPPWHWAPGAICLGYLCQYHFVASADRSWPFWAQCVGMWCPRCELYCLHCGWCLVGRSPERW